MTVGVTTLSLAQARG